MKPTIPPHRRDMIFRIMDDRHDLIGLMFEIQKHKLCDHMFKWLLDNNITGKNLADWVKTAGVYKKVLDKIEARLERSMFQQKIR